MTTCVLVVTGGRSWRHAKELKLFLLGHLAYYGAGLLLYVGDCPTGADLHAREFAEQMHIKEQLRVFDADWDAEGKAAGPNRNRRMLDAAVAEPADEKRVLACHDALEWSKGGTNGCCKEARQRDLPVFHLRRLGRQW